jgi:hypothetical protein
MVIVEIRTGGSDASPRYERLQAATLNIGRAPDNNLIIEDPYVDAHHLRLDVAVAGEWQVTDLDSTNGTTQGRQAVHVARLAPGAQLKLGKTLIRVFDEHYQVAPALSLADLEHRLLDFNRWRSMLMLVAVLVAYVTLRVYLAGDGADAKADAYLVAIVTALLWPLSIAGAWALLSRLLRGEARFRPILNLGLLAMVISTGLQLINSLIEYNLPGTRSQLPELLIILGVLGIYLYLMLLISTRLQDKLRLGLTLVVAGGLLLSFSINQYSVQDRFSPAPRYDNTLYAPWLLYRDGVTAEDFRQGLDSLFETADDLAETKD